MTTLFSQPTHLFTYLSLKKRVVSSGIKSLFYMSFEDALWDLLAKKNIPQGSIVLVPELYCFDVEENIRAHGYVVQHYLVEENLQTAQPDLLRAITLWKPKVLVILHAQGITNMLLERRTWMKNLDTECLLIEDAVHRVVNPTTLRIFRKNHFVIDSLRKVIPLQGSFLYGRPQDLAFRTPPVKQALWYAWTVMASWLLMAVMWGVSPKWAESVMEWGYDKIGDSLLSAKGWGVMAMLSWHIDDAKISRIKAQQVNIYEKELLSTLGNVAKVVPYTGKDSGQLRGWPIILQNTIADSFLQHVRSAGLPISFNLGESVWSSKQKLISLPLGPYLSDKAIYTITQIVCRALTTTLERDHDENLATFEGQSITTSVI